MTSLTDMPADIRLKAEEVVIHGAVENRAATCLLIAQAILSERQRDQWQDIATAPKDGTRVLGFWEYTYHGDTKPTQGCEIIEWSHGRYEGWRGEEGVAAVGVFRAWQPLPAPPKGGA